MSASVLLLALLLSLGPTAVAGAEEPGSTQTTVGEETPSQQTEPVTSEQPSGEGATQAAPEEASTSPASEPTTTESASTSEATTEPSPEQGTQEQISVQVPETPVTVEVPIETPPLEVVAVPEVPAVEQVKQVLTETLTPETHVEKSPEATAPETTKEHSSEGSGALSVSSTSTSSATTSVPVTIAASSEAPLVTSTAPVSQDPMQILEGAEPTLTSPTAHRKAAAQLAAARRTGSLSCELSALEGAISQACAAAQTPATLPAADSLYMTDGERATAAASSAHAEGSDAGGSSGDGRPAAPTPGPAPGGAAGGAPGGGGSAGGLSGFLTRPELHLRFTPRAMRRLKLAQLPWRTAFFVLIPERPG